MVPRPPSWNRKSQKLLRSLDVGQACCDNERARAMNTKQVPVLVKAPYIGNSATLKSGTLQLQGED